MSAHELAEAIMELPEPDRLNLARRIVASIVADREIAQEAIKAVEGIEDIITGKLRGLTEAEFREALK